MKRKLGMLAAAMATVAAGTLGWTPGMPPAGADPVPMSKSCTVDGVTWRADYTSWADSYYGPIVKVDGLKRIQGGVETDASTLTWEWRLDHPPSWHGTWDALKNRFLRGPLQPRPAEPENWWMWYGVEWQSVIYSPRVVSPGGCDIYFSPFSNIGGNPAWPKVAVLGDSLLGGLNNQTVNANNIQGFAEQRLKQNQTLAEIEGQGGRRWTITETTGTPLEMVDSYMLDEYRALIQEDLAGVVVGLGANDALTLAFTPAAEKDARRTLIHNKLFAVLAEMTAGTDCLVAVTAPEHANSFYGAGQPYADEALTINSILRWIAASDADDAFHVAEFGLQAKDHQYNPANPNDPNSWFGADNLHFNETGAWAYADVIQDAAALCTG